MDLDFEGGAFTGAFCNWGVFAIGKSHDDSKKALQQKGLMSYVLMGVGW
jgi:hypothetical protein